MSSHEDSQRLAVVSTVLVGAAGAVIYIPRGGVGDIIAIYLLFLIVLCVYFLISLISELRYSGKGRIGRITLSQKSKELSFDMIAESTYVSFLLFFGYCVGYVSEYIIGFSHGASLAISGIVVFCISSTLAYLDASR